MADQDQSTIFLNYNNQRYPINSKVLEGLSESFCFLKISDPLIEEITLSTKFKKPPITEFMQLLENLYSEKTIKKNPITKNNYPFYCEMAAELGISTLLTLIHETLSNENLLADALFFTKLYETKNVDYFVFTDLIADNLEYFNKPEFFKLSVPTISMIFDSAFIVPDPQIQLSVLEQIFDYQNEPNHPLLRFMPFGIIPEAEINKLLRNPFFNYNKIKDLFLSYESPPTTQSAVSAYLPDPENKFQGIIAAFEPYLEYSEPYDSNHSIDALLSPNLEQYYCSKLENGRIKLTFQQKILLTHLEIRAWKFGKNGVCPKDWVLEGQSSENVWEIIDSSTNHINKHLNDNYGYQLFEIHTEKAYQSIQFTQKSVYNYKNKRLALSGFELYGTVYENQ